VAAPRPFEPEKRQLHASPAPARAQAWEDGDDAVCDWYEALDDSDDAVSRSLVLKFFSSVRS
jgi:hypothetical protein